MNGFSSLDQIGTALYARRKWMALVGAATFVLVIAICAVLPSRYSATSNIVFNTRASDAIVDKNDTWGFNAYINGEVDLIGSRRVMERAASDPQLLDSALTLAQQSDHQKGKAPLKAWIANFIAANTQIAAAKNTRTVSITATFDDPKFAALVADAIAHAYLATALELRVTPARQNVVFYRAQRAARGAELARAQAALDAFLRETGMTGHENNADDDVQLRVLAERLGAVRATQAGSAAESSVGRVDSAVAVGKISNPVISQLRHEIATQSADLRDLTVLSGPNYPDVIKNQARLRELQGQLAAELAKVDQGIQRNNLTATRETNQISSLESTYRRSLSASAADRSRLDVLDGDIAQDKAIYDQVSARLADLELQSALESPNAAVLSRAEDPHGPSFPVWPLIIAVAFGLALVTGAISALAVELLFPRVRSRLDLETLLGGAPVLCDLTA